MEKNIAGDMVVEQWECLRRRYRMLKLHDFVVMPNHFHGIVEIVGEPLVGSREMVKHFDQVNRRKGQLQEIVPTLSSIVGSFKSITTNEYIKLVKSKNIPRFDRSLWQRSFHDHVIRSEESLLKIQEYIANNPLKWELDYYFQKT